METHFEALVIGAGINGLSTAWWLLKRGLRRVAVIEKGTIGHDRGSSHGRSRITRSAYADSLYLKLMQVAHGEAWPALEADAGEKLLHPRDGCFFGPRQGKFQDYIEAIEGTGVAVEEVDVGEARRRFPAFRFPGDLAVLHDRTAAVVAARDTMAALERIVRRGAVVMEGTEVLGLDPGGRVAVDTVTDGVRGRLTADRVIVTAGAWVGKLVPALAPSLRVVRQTVVYARIDGDPKALPVWVWRGERDFYYGLPEFQRPGIKAAKHVLGGREDDPDAPADTLVDTADTAPVWAFLQEHLARPPLEILATERCLYTVAPDEDFVIDRLPGTPSVVVGSACSGHGFKFGPLTGRILAELALDGKSTVEGFEAERGRFRLPGNVP